MRGNVNAREKFLLDDPAEVQEDAFTRKAAVIPCDQDDVIIDWRSGILNSNVGESSTSSKRNCRDGRESTRVNS
jgi:hypothetical protein